MRKHEEFLQKNLDYFRDNYSKLLDIKQQFDLLAVELKTISAGVRAEADFHREAREHARDWNGILATQAQAVKELGTRQEFLIEKLNQSEEALVHIMKATGDFHVELEAFKMEMQARTAETKKEIQQMLLEFLTKMNGLVAEQEQKVSAGRNRAFF